MAIRLGKQFFLIFISVLTAAHFASGEGTRTWEQSKFEELSKGTAMGVAIRSIGGLELAPAFKAMVTTPSSLYLGDCGGLRRKPLCRRRGAGPRLSHHAAGTIDDHL